METRAKMPTEPLEPFVLQSLPTVLFSYLFYRINKQNHFLLKRQAKFLKIQQNRVLLSSLRGSLVFPHSR